VIEDINELTVVGIITIVGIIVVAVSYCRNKIEIERQEEEHGKSYWEWEREKRWKQEELMKQRGGNK